MQLYKTRVVTRFTRKQRILDASLAEAVDRATRGLIDADLGGGLIKQRIARKSEGRSGGYRFIVCFRKGDLAIFLHGFAKKDQDNISDDQSASYREIAAYWLAATPEDIAKAQTTGLLTEVKHDPRSK